MEAHRSEQDGLLAPTKVGVSLARNSLVADGPPNPVRCSSLLPNPNAGLRALRGRLTRSALANILMSRHSYIINGAREKVAEQASGVLAGVRLDHSSPVPLYHQAAQALERAIDDGRLPRGSKLDGELDLAEQLGISRPTMRAALKQLVDKGLLIRRRGIGTVIATKPVRRAVALTSLYDDLKESGREPTTRVLDLEETLCPPEIAEQLGLGP